MYGSALILRGRGTARERARDTPGAVRRHRPDVGSALGRGTGPVLVDTSAWMQARRDAGRAIFAIMREVAADGAHRFPLTDLTVATAAQRAGIEILRFDRHLQRLGDHLGVEAHWISAPT